MGASLDDTKNATGAAQLTAFTLDMVWGKGIGALVAPGFPWRTVGLGMGIHLLGGVGLAHISELLDSIRVGVLAVLMFAFVTSFGIALGAMLQRVSLTEKILILTGSVTFFFVLKALPAFGSWLGAKLLGPEALANATLPQVFQTWLHHNFYQKFADADGFWQAVGGYRDLFDGVDGFLALAVAFVSAIINFIPDYAMYSVSKSSPDASVAWTNYAIFTVYWLCFAGLFTPTGYTMARNFDQSVRANEDFLDDIDKPGPRYAVLGDLGSGGRDESPDGTLFGAARFLGFRVPPFHEAEYFDTGGTKEGAAQAAKAAVHAKFPIVFGPLGSEEVFGAGPVLRRAGIPAITFTTDENPLGEGIYSLTWRTDAEVAAIITYATQQAGLRHFATLFPASLGPQAHKAVDVVVKANAATLVAAGTYGLSPREDELAFARVIGAMRNPIGLLMCDPKYAARCMQYFATLSPPPAKPRLLGIGPWYFDGKAQDDQQDVGLESAWFAAPPGFKGSLRSLRPEFKRYCLHGSEIVWLAEKMDLVGQQSGRKIRKSLKQNPTLDIPGKITLRPGKLAEREMAIFEIRNGWPEMIYGTDLTDDDEGSHE